MGKRYYIPYQPDRFKNLNCGIGYFNGMVYKSNGFPANGIIYYDDNSYYSGELSQNVCGQRNGNGVLHVDVTGDPQVVAEVYWGQWTGNEINGKGGFTQCILSGK